MERTDFSPPFFLYHTQIFVGIVVKQTFYLEYGNRIGLGKAVTRRDPIGGYGKKHMD